MLLTVIRDEIKKDYTGGVLLVDGKEFSRTIEPPRGYASGPVTCNQSPVTSHPPKYGVPKAQQSRSYPCGKELCSNGNKPCNQSPVTIPKVASLWGGIKFG